MHKIRLLNVVLPKSKGASLFYFGEHEDGKKSFFYGDVPFFSRHVVYFVELAEKEREQKEAKPAGRNYLVQTHKDMVNKTNKVISNRNAKYIQFYPTKSFVMNSSFGHYAIVSIQGIEFNPFKLSDYEQVSEYLFIYMAYHQFNAPGLKEMQETYKSLLEEKKETKTTALWGAINKLIVSGDSEALYMKEMNEQSVKTLGTCLDPATFVNRWIWLNKSGLLTRGMLSVKKWSKHMYLESAHASAYLSNVNTKPIIDALYHVIHSCPLWFLANASTFHVDLRENTLTFKQSTDDMFIFPFKTSSNELFAWTSDYLIKFVFPYMLETNHLTNVQHALLINCLLTWNTFCEELHKSGSDYSNILTISDKVMENAPENYELKTFIVLTDAFTTIKDNGTLMDLPLWLQSMKGQFDNILVKSLSPVVMEQDKFSTIYQPREQYLAKELILDTFQELYNTRKWKCFDTVFMKPTETTLTKEQKDIMQAIDNHAIIVITGGPGVGKSFMINKIIEKYTEDHVDVLAQTGCVVSHLRHKGKVIMANTIDSSYRNKLHVKKEVVIIDEAAMLDNRTLAMALMVNRHVQKKLILIADENQIGPIGLGFPYVELKTYYTKYQETMAKGFLYFGALTRNFRVSDNGSHLTDLQHMYKEGKIRPEAFPNSCPVQIHLGDNIMEQVKSIVEPLLKFERVMESIIILSLLVEKTKEMNALVNKMLMKQWYNIEGGNYYFVGQRIMITEMNVYEVSNEPVFNRERIHNGEMYYIEKMELKGGESVKFTQHRENIILHVVSEYGLKRILHIIKEEDKVEYSKQLMHVKKDKSHISIFILTMTQIGYGWSITVNKAQGSEYDHVLFVIHQDKDVVHFKSGHGLVALSRSKKQLTLAIPSVSTLHRLASQTHNQRKSNLASLLAKSKKAIWHKQ